MAAEKAVDKDKSHFRLRSCILKALYELFKECPYAPIEPGQIMDVCRTDARELNWNLVYLEKCGLVELGRSYDNPPFIACSMTLTAQGIDLIEDEDTFDARFADK